MSRERLPCGCVIGTETLPDGTKAFVFQPHALDCQYYRYFQEQSVAQDKPVRVMDLRGDARRLAAQACPTCGEKLDAVTDTSGGNALPSPGDLTICLMCGAILRFGDELVLAVPTYEQLDEVPPELNVLQRRIMERRR